MFKKIKPFKDLLWAAGIGITLLALLVGLVAASFTSYHGDRTRPVMDLRSGQTEKQAAKDESKSGGASSDGIQADGTLHILAKTSKAKKSYLDGLTILCDSSMISLRGSELCGAAIWSSESGTLSMNAIDDWMVRFPSDGSLVSPSNAVLIEKPEILILAVGNDSSAGMSKQDFISSYSELIEGLVKANPDAKIVCLSLCSVTSVYVGSDSMTPETAGKINGWIREVCMQTGAYYGDMSDTLYEDGCLRDDYADGSGRALNTAGLEAVLDYLRTHNVNKQ